MKSAPFDYRVSDVIDEVLTWLAQDGPDAKLLAGGQSLIPALNMRQLQPSLLIDINRLKTLDYIKHTDDGILCIGALTRQRYLEMHTAQICPLLHETMPHIGRPQVRNRGTIGGSLSHGAPAGELPAVMVALNAQFVIQSVQGNRIVAAHDFFVDAFKTALKPNEMLTEIRIPPALPNTGYAFIEFARQFSGIALMGVTLTLTLDDNQQCKQVRLAYLNAHRTTYDASATAQRLMQGTRYSPALIDAVINDIVNNELQPPSSLQGSKAYQLQLARVLTRQAFATAFKRTQGAFS